MSLPIVLLLYFISGAALFFFSMKCADYVDLLDKKTNLSGAFIGGVILAAITSLPELITSISAVTVVNKPELIIGNVLGSNVFNNIAAAVSHNAFGACAQNLARSSSFKMFRKSDEIFCSNILPLQEFIFVSYHIFEFFSIFALFLSTSLVL